MVAGDAMTAGAIGDGPTDASLVATPRFEFTDSPLLGVLNSTGVAATIITAVVGESEDLRPLPVQSDTPQAKLSSWNKNTKFQLVMVRNSNIFVEE